MITNAQAHVARLRIPEVLASGYKLHQASRLYQAVRLYQALRGRSALTASRASQAHGPNGLVGWCQAVGRNLPRLSRTRAIPSTRLWGSMVENILITLFANSIPSHKPRPSFIEVYGRVTARGRWLLSNRDAAVEGNVPFMPSW
jgi:hypothetical protein